MNRNELSVQAQSNNNDNIIYKSMGQNLEHRNVERLVF